MGIEALDYGFMRSALLAGVTLGRAVCADGHLRRHSRNVVFQRLRRTLRNTWRGAGAPANFDPALFLIPYSLVMAFAVAMVWNSFSLSRDTVLGVFVGGSLSLGLIIVSVKGIGQATLMQFLFGDILLIGRPRHTALGRAACGVRDLPRL